MVKEKVVVRYKQSHVLHIKIIILALWDFQERAFFGDNRYSDVYSSLINGKVLIAILLYELKLVTIMGTTSL